MKYKPKLRLSLKEAHDYDASTVKAWTLNEARKGLRVLTSFSCSKEGPMTVNVYDVVLKAKPAISKAQR